MKDTLRINIIPAFLALILLFVTINAFEQMHRWWKEYTPAIEWHGIDFVQAKVAPGGQLSVVYSATIHKQCPSDLHTFIIAPDGSVPVRYPVIAGGYSRPSEGPTKIRVVVKIPLTADSGLKPLSSGRHVYRTFAVRYCPEGVEQDLTVPDAAFDLEVG